MHSASCGKAPGQPQVQVNWWEAPPLGQENHLELEKKADAPVKRGGLPHKVHLEVMCHLHRCTHTAPQLNGDLITIICASELRFFLVTSWFTFLRSPRLVRDIILPLYQKVTTQQVRRMYSPTTVLMVSGSPVASPLPLITLLSPEASPWMPGWSPHIQSPSSNCELLTVLRCSAQSTLVPGKVVLSVLHKWCALKSPPEERAWCLEINMTQRGPSSHSQTLHPRSQD